MDAVREIEPSEARLADVVALVRDTIRRRWLVLALVTAGVFLVGAVVIFRMPPRYTATASVQIDPSRNPLISKASEGKMELTPEAIETEVSIITSTRLAQQVVRDLRLTQDPELANDLSGESGATLSTASAREAAIARRLLQGLSVSREKLTYLIQISYTSSSGAKSARIANAFARGYIQSKVANSTGKAGNQAEWFRRRLAELSEDARQADARVAQFRAQTGIVQGSGGNNQAGTILDQQVAPLASALALAESEAAGARSSYDAARGQVGRGGIDNVAAVLNSDVVANLRTQRADVLRNMGEVEARYGERHPETIRVRDQLAKIDGQIQAEARRVLGSLQSTAVANDARAASLRSSLSRLEGQRADDTRNSVIAESLEREAAAKRALYDRMTQLSLDSTQAARVSMAQAEVVDEAQAPAAPTSPNRPLLLALAAIVALGAGLGTIAVQEMTSGGLRSVDEIEREFRLPVLAAVPLVPGNDNPADLLLDQPTSFFAEALRVARASVIGVRSQAAPKIIAITSALPSEGKTTTAVAFARMLATSKAKTLLIECDVRRAVVRRMVRVPLAPAGLVEVLHGEAAVDDAIVQGDMPLLDHLLVSDKYFSSENLFGEGAMQTLLDGLASRYDQIVLDLPPLLGLADGRTLAAFADTTILAVRWNATPRAAVASAINFLEMDGTRIAGILLTLVDSSAEAMGGLNYYSSKYSAYYQSK